MKKITFYDWTARYPEHLTVRQRRYRKENGLSRI